MTIIFLLEEKSMKAWRQPDTKFVIVQDQDSADCLKLKQLLQDMVSPFGREVLIRIACKELESWYFGDLEAVSKAYGKNVTALSLKSKYRNPDKIENPKRELQKLFPNHQQLDGARRIAVHMNLENNSSASFRYFVEGIKKLVDSN